MRTVWLGRLGLAAAVAVLAVAGSGSQACAQDRTKIEVVPQNPHSAPVNSIALSPDGARVLSGSDDKTAKLWDADTGALLRTFEVSQADVTTVVACTFADTVRPNLGLPERFPRLSRFAARCEASPAFSKAPVPPPPT
jgi:WD40 repeat protein